MQTGDRKLAMNQIGVILIVFTLFVGSAFHTNAYFGAGTGQIFLDDVCCAGNESSLLECMHDPIGINNCTHYEDVGVTCTSEIYTIIYGSFNYISIANRCVFISSIIKLY